MKGILFKESMQKAIRDGRKTQTRRVIKPQPKSNLWYGCVGGKGFGFFDSNSDKYKPRYSIGEVVYMKEAWQPCPEYRPVPEPDKCPKFWYKSDNNSPTWVGQKWKSPMFLPESAARTFLRITDVRVQRVNEITEEDVINEGVDAGLRPALCWWYEFFSELWDSINKPPIAWENNPYVFAYSFELTKEK